MFRASMCPSSGENCRIYAKLVFVALLNLFTSLYKDVWSTEHKKSYIYINFVVSEHFYILDACHTSKNVTCHHFLLLNSVETMGVRFYNTSSSFVLPFYVLLLAIELSSSHCPSFLPHIFQKRLFHLHCRFIFGAFQCDCLPSFTVSLHVTLLCYFPFKLPSYQLPICLPSDYLPFSLLNLCFCVCNPISALLIWTCKANSCCLLNLVQSQWRSSPPCLWGH